MADYSKMLSDLLHQGVESGDQSQIDHALQGQRNNGVISEILSQATGADPAQINPLTVFNEPEMEVSRIALHWAKQGSQIAQAAEQAGASQLRQLWKERIVDKYRKANEEPIKQWREGLSGEEQIALMQQMSPVEVDPNELAEMQQMAVKIDQAIKKVNPKVSFWTHPDFKDIAGWLNREASPYSPGYFFQGPQQMPFGASLSASVIDLEQNIEDLGMNLIHAAWDFGRLNLWSMGLADYAVSPPTNLVKDDDTGEILYNAGRPHGLVSILSAIRSQVLGHDVAEDLASLGKAREMEESQRNLLDRTVHSVASVVGMFAGFAPGAAVMRAGQQAGKNLMKDALVSVGSNMTGKTAKALQVMGEYTGAAVTNGAMMSAAYGRMSDYGHEFMNGAIMAPVILALGSMGKGTEKWLEQRVKAPAWLAKDVNQAMQGAGFATMETLQTGALWDFLKDPNSDTWEVYAQNMLGFIISSRLMGRGLTDLETEKARRTSLRRQFAEEVATGRRPIESLQEEASPREIELIHELGRAQVVGREALSRGKRDKAARQRIMEIEKELDVIAAGTEPKGELERRKMGQGPAELFMAREPQKARPQRPKPPVEEVAPELSVVEGKYGLFEVVDKAGDVKMSGFGQESAAHEWIRVRGHIPPLGEVPGTKRNIYGRVEHPQFSKAPKGGFEESYGGIDVPIERQPGARRASLRNFLHILSGDPGSPGFKIFNRRVLAREGDPVQVPIRTGKLGRIGVDALYKILENVIRTTGGGVKKAIEAAHEWSHSMFGFTYGRGRDVFDAADEWLHSLPPGAEAEAMLLMRDYPGGVEMRTEDPGRYANEVWTMAFSREMLSDSRLSLEAPIIRQWMSGWLAENPRVWEQFSEARDEFWNYLNIGAEMRGIEETGTSALERQLKKENLRKIGSNPVTRLARRYSKYMADELLYVKRDRERWLRARGISETSYEMFEDPVRMREYLQGKAGAIAHDMMVKGMVDPYGREVGQPLEKVLERAINELKVAPGVENTGENRLSVLSQYMAAHRYMDLIKSGKKTAHPEHEYIARIQAIEARNPGIKEIARQFKMFTDQLVDYYAESGGTSPEKAQALKDSNAFYLPFQYAMEAQFGVGNRPHKATGLRRLKGTTRETLLDPIAAMEDAVIYIVNKSHQARIQRSLAMHAAKGGTGGFAEIVPKDRVPKELRADVVIDALRKIELKEESERDVFDNILEDLASIDGIDEAVLTVFSQKAWPEGEKNIIPVSVNTPEWEMEYLDKVDPVMADKLRGMQDKMVWIEVEGSTYATLMGLEQTAFPAWARAVGKVIEAPTRLLHGALVGYNPLYPLFAIARDIMSKGTFVPGQGYAGGRLSYVPGGSAVGGVMDAMKGLYHMIKRTPEYEWLDRMEFGVSTFSAAGTSKRVINRVSGTFASKTLVALKKGADRWKSIIGSSDKILRVTAGLDAYKKARAEGKPEELARMIATESAMKSMIDFSKGGVVARFVNKGSVFFKAGVLGWYKTIQGLNTPRGFIAAMSAITFPKLLSWWLFKDDDWYQELPLWERRNYIHLSFDGGQNIARIPLPFELGVIMGAFPEYLADQAEGAERDDIGAIFQEALIPYIKNVQSLAPDIIKPFAETAVGESFYFQDPLTPFYLERKPGEQQVKPSTLESSKLMYRIFGKFLPFVDNPIEMQHLLDSYSGKWFTRLAMVGEDIAGIQDHADYINMNPIGRFVSHPFSQSRSVEWVYDEAENLRLEAQRRDLTGQERAKQAILRNAKAQMSVVRQDAREGKLTRDEANRKLFEIGKQAKEAAKQ